MGAHCCSEPTNNQDLPSRILKQSEPMTVTTTGDEPKPEDFGKAINTAYLKPVKVANSISKYGLYKFENSASELKGTESLSVKKGESVEGVYEGQMLGSRKHGKGHWVNKEGDLYVARFFEDEADGIGAVYFANGNYFFGRLTRGDLEQGKMIYPNGQTYVGNFVNGKRNGKGKTVYPDGRLYEGNWLDDLEHGSGMITTEGTWEKGQLKTTKKPTIEVPFKQTDAPAAPQQKVEQAAVPPQTKQQPPQQQPPQQQAPQQHAAPQKEAQQAPPVTSK